MQPIIGITVDNRENTRESGTYECAIAYTHSVVAAGGLPMLLPHIPEAVPDYVQRCHGLMLTGGVDPDTRGFGEPLHPKARCMDSMRQAFELALLEAVRSASHPPAVLGICLGMQMLALHAGGRLDQYMPETLGEATGNHTENRQHAITLTPFGEKMLGTSAGPYEVVSSHRQRIEDVGSLDVVAQAPDGTIEAVADPHAAFYVGVQWHPERGGDEVFSRLVFDRLVASAKERMSAA